VSQQALIDTTAGVELSLDDWIALPEDEPGELVDGQLVEEEVPSYVHEFLVVLLARLLGDWAIPRGGLVAGSDAKFVVGPDRGRKPDLTVYFPESRFPPAHGAVSVPPDVAVEIVSPTPRDGRRDRVEKITEYAAFGIRYYWLVDPQMRSLEVLELGADGRYAHAVGQSAGVVEDVPGCAGLTVDLDALWGEVERLEARARAEEESGQH
jgi:Uma2 family endonuclease